MPRDDIEVRIQYGAPFVRLGTFGSNVAEVMLSTAWNPKYAQEAREVIEALDKAIEEKEWYGS